MTEVEYWEECARKAKTTGSACAAWGMKIVAAERERCAAEHEVAVKQLVTVMNVSARAAVAAERERCAAEVERLRAALRAIADDPEAGVNIALYVKAALGSNP
jgi:hypothetical protein